MGPQLLEKLLLKCPFWAVFGFVRVPLTNVKTAQMCAHFVRLEHYRGPDIPCFLKIEKWIITKIRVTSGKTNV